MHSILRILLMALVPALTLPAFAQSAGQADPLFAQDEMLDVRISAPVDTLLRDRPDEEELSGTFTWQEAGQPEQSVYIAIRTRGNYRRDRSNCPFPPLRLNFRKSEVEGTLLDGQDKVKLVTHCRTGSGSYEEGLLKEYMAYRMLNAVTDLSFRVRLLEITYVDSDRDGATEKEYGFLIESDDRLAERIGLEIVEVPSTTVSSLDPAYTNLVSLFHYMIGNTDFSPIAGPPNEKCCHNVELYADEQGTQFPIPYDFDMSGIVDAKYAVPNPKLKIRSVKQRLYRGRCENNPQLGESVARFLDRQQQIYDVIERTPALDKGDRRQVRRFVDRFFETIEDPKDIEYDIVRECL